MTDIMNESMTNALWVCLVIAFAASSISYTITQTELFVPVRNLSQKFGHMIGYLFSCFYCMSHWVIIAGVLVYQPILISSGHTFVDIVVSIFFIITISTFISGFIFKVFLTAISMKIKEKEMKELLSKK